MTFYVFVWFLGLVFTLIKGKSANLTWSFCFELDFLTILIAYLFLFYRLTSVAAFAFGQGLFIDVFSGGLHGLFTFLYLSVFGVIYLGSQFIDLQDFKGQVMIISVAVLLKKIVFLMMLTLFPLEVVFSETFILKSMASAIVTGLIGPVLFHLFNRLMGVSLDGRDTSKQQTRARR